MTDTTAPATPNKRGPKTPEGKARSARNAQRHGLRARTFGILPEEEQAEWAEHLADLRAGYGPVDDTELKLVDAIAAAMWNEIRADRTLAEVLAAIPPLAPAGRTAATCRSPGTRCRLNTALRYLTAASMASQRAQRAFLAHRKAKRDGLLLPEPDGPARRRQRKPHERKRGRGSEMHERIAARRSAPRRRAKRPARPAARRFWPHRAPRSGIWSRPSGPPGCPVPLRIAVPSTGASSPAADRAPLRRRRSRLAGGTRARERRTARVPLTARRRASARPA